MKRLENSILELNRTTENISKQIINIEKKVDIIEKKKNKLEKWSQIFTIIGAIAAVIGIISVIIALSQNLPIVQAHNFSSKVSKIKIGQNYRYFEVLMGIPNLEQPIEYKSIKNDSNEIVICEGLLKIYYKTDYMFGAYFDNENNLFGYVVISNNKYFTPKVPKTSEDFDNSFVLSKKTFNSIDDLNGDSLENGISFFARSGDKYIEMYCVNIYNYYNKGILGVAYTDFSKSALRNERIFKVLANISVPNKEYPFYEAHKDNFKNFTFYSMDDVEVKKIRSELFTDTEIGEYKPNAFFFFAKDGFIDIHSFIEENLTHKFFMDNITISLQK